MNDRRHVYVSKGEAVKHGGGSIMPWAVAAESRRDNKEEGLPPNPSTSPEIMSYLGEPWTQSGSPTGQ